MPEENKIFATEFNGWALRVRPAQAGIKPRLLLLLHGWKGDETVMWIFTRRFPTDTWLVAPRAPIAAPDGGYGWHPHIQGRFARLEDFTPAITDLLAMIDAWGPANGVDASRFSLMGFSQGAAVSLALALRHPQRVERIAALAGYLPEGGSTAIAARALADKPVYVAHGSLDETIPVAIARQGVQRLQQAGAEVTYCESEVGHKLSLDCMRGLNEFFA